MFVGSAGADGPGETIEQYTVAFDSSRYIDVDEIEAGMRGYGLTVFQGTEPQRFEIEVIGIIRQFMAHQRGIMIRVVDNPEFEQAAGVEGVSGSPVYIDGRLAGAMAFGWSFGEEPLYGVTPIRDMLEVRQASRVQNTSSVDTPGAFHFGTELYTNMLRPQLLSREQVRSALMASGLAKRAEATQGLTTFPLPLTLSNISPAAQEAINEYLPDLAVNVGIGGGMGSDAGPDEPAAELVPGATVTVPLIAGDMNGAILGTVTEVIGDQVYAFGHAWNGEGAARWPMATGKIITFVSRANISFKLGEPLEIVGALLADEASAVYGEIGATANMVPVRIHVRWVNTGFDETVNAQIAQDELADPMLATISLLASVLRRGGLPREHTIDYHIRFEFDSIDPIEFTNRSSAAGPMEFVFDCLEPLYMLLNNPWGRVNLTDVSAEFTIQHENNVCFLEAASIGQRIYRPGQTVTAQLRLAPLLGSSFEQSISLELPGELPDGLYTIVVGSWDVPVMLMMDAQPNRAMAFDLESLHDVMQRRLGFQRNAAYIAMVIPQPGIAIENNELPHLPGSQLMLLNDPSRRQAVMPWQPIITNTVEMPWVLNGAQSFEIEVRSR